MRVVRNPPTKEYQKIQGMASRCNQLRSTLFWFLIFSIFNGSRTKPAKILQFSSPFVFYRFGTNVYLPTNLPTHLRAELSIRKQKIPTIAFLLLSSWMQDAWPSSLAAILPLKKQGSFTSHQCCMDSCLLMFVSNNLSSSTVLQQGILSTSPEGLEVFWWDKHILGKMNGNSKR